MSEGRVSRKVRETESPKVRKKPVQKDSFEEAGSPKSEEENNSAPPTGGLHSNLTAHSEIDNPHSEIKEPLTTHNSPLTTMEVHHHPEVEKKGLKEYVLEGLMIFLAVTMGFFAETIRENISENGKAKELAKSLYQEVYADSVNMQKKIMLRVEKDRQINYFRKYALDSSLTNLSDKFYPSFTWSFVLTSTIIFDPNDGILNQLRNSGTQRYFKSIQLQNCISRLNVSILNLRNRNNQEYAFVEQFTRPFLLKHYDFIWHDEFTHNGNISILQAILQTRFHPVRPPRIKNINEFKREDAEALAAYYLLIIRATKQVFYNPYIEANHQLLQALRKEYYFENE